MNLPTQIELRSIRALLPYARNSRTHSDEQVAQVAASMREFGWTSPILVDAEGTVIAGHARLLAARKLEMTEVPVIVLGHLSDTQRRAYLIADNKLTELGGWDAEALSLELRDLQDAEFDLELLGFSDQEIEALAGETGLEQSAVDVEEDAVPEPPAQPVTMPGDVWLIGPHRLICGDCRDAAVVGKLMAGASANVAITSPPYATQREYDPTERVQAGAARGVRGLVPCGGRRRRGGAGAGRFLSAQHQGARRRGGAEPVRDGSWCWPTGASGAGGSWMNSAGGRLTTACRAVGKTASRTPGNLCSTSAAKQQIKFRAEAVSHASDDCFNYSPDNPKSNSGSGLLGTGARGDAAGQAGCGRFAKVGTLAWRAPAM